MHTRIVTLGIASLLYSFIAAAGSTLPTSKQQALLLYKIGGGHPVSAPVSNLTTSISVGGQVDYGLGYSCGLFDPKASVKHTIDNIEEDLVTLKDQATASVAGLPGYIFCRANPQACQLLQHNTIRAEERFRVDIASCEKLEQMGREGKGLDDWIKIGRAEAWKQQAQQGHSATKAKKEVNKNAGKKGISWIGGKKAGGEGQPPIRPVSDAALVGYNILHRRNPDNTSPLPRSVQSRTQRTWSSPGQAQAWITNAVGDQSIRVTQGAQPVSSPGIGLLPQVEAHQKQAKQNLLAALKSPTDNSLLSALSSQSMTITPQVIKALRVNPMREALMESIAGDLALSQVIDQALMARRLLITGRDFPDIAAHEPAQERIDEGISRLEQEVDRLLFERKARKELWSDALASVLEASGSGFANTAPMSESTDLKISP